MRLIDGGSDRSINDQQHFYALAAETMRHVLIDNARRRKSLKRGGNRKRTAFVDDPAAPNANLANRLALDDAIIRLGEVDPESARIIQLHCFGGHTLAETAEVMGISRTQAYRLWSFARAWLLNDFRQNDG
jgi:RNA polymerase sigma factor (TIGR02999 family)